MEKKLAGMETALIIVSPAGLFFEYIFLPLMWIVLLGISGWVLVTCSFWWKLSGAITILGLILVAIPYLKYPAPWFSRKITERREQQKATKYYRENEARIKGDTFPRPVDDD